MSTNKTDRAFKTLINKRTTDSVGKNFYNEVGDFTINVCMDEIWFDKIDPTPQLAIDANIAKEYTLYELTEDPTVPNQACWYTDSDEGRLKDWISDKYGSDYEAKLFTQDGQEIFKTDACDWFFDYQTGILTFNGSISGFSKPFKISGFRYIGTKGLGGDGGVISIKSFPTCTTPYNKTLQCSIPAIIGEYVIEFDLANLPVADKEVEVAAYSYACTGYHDGDFLTLKINDTIIEDTWYTREIPEESVIGPGGMVYAIPKNSKIRAIFNNESGQSRILWFKIKLIYNP